ncbi:PAS domain S-box-containing protein/diguanylate cyclase (GGDEF)-like protein [Saccharothrix carnea]|uniref:PAS domain S-box-containing protein/diguanylate cyclase (GGDEF)-like protein n=1 Tax=Saccharothrix carnea TaxID=1280637 RepID=A0A2P8IDJ7_SACCR|nr:EAL domain-containing protein [Saccharothrix carnea]PSL56532.1 PAS domain S-box-containing protein/diguanylate cyclase (GGDEF)-like protein [Saccharothrix carnea]
MNDTSLPGRTRRQDIAREWMRAVYPTAYVPLSPAEIESFLLGLVDVIADAIQAEPFAVEPVDVVGHRLVRAHFTGPETLQRTVGVLGHALLFSPELRDVPQLAEKVVAILGSVSTGFATAMRLDAFDQQEEVKRALLTAKLRAERVLKVSEARFREVFDSSAFGIAITDLDGRCVEVNEALAEMIGRDRGELTGRRLVELFDPADTDALATTYRAVGSGRVARIREQRRLLREDGEPVWVHLAVSLLRDADGEPAYHVTMAEDVSELHLLQKNLDFQLLHDSLTGLSNRQRFATRLEALHGTSRAGITLYHLGLDAFSLVNNGLGHAVGDRLLIEVGHRLEALVEDEVALVARLGGDEFGIVVDNSPGTPTVPDMVDRINEALRRPMDNGVALSATIGVVDRPPAGWGVAEILRAGDATLRRAKEVGKRQWLPYDRHADQATRERQARAARMPGALADHELEVEYQPVVDLAGGGVLGHVARLRWDDLGHDECVELAEQTGLSLAVGQWALHEAAGDANGPESFGVLYFELSPMQSRDEDLVRTVKRTLDETGLPASRLRIFLDTRSMLAGMGEDNAQVLRDNGIATGLTRFNGGQAELALIDELQVDALVLDPSVVRRLAERPESFLHAAVERMVALIRSSGVAVLVPDLSTGEQAAWWTRVEVDAAFGDHLAPAVPSYELSGT